MSIANAPDLQEKLNAYKDKDIKEIVFDATDLVHLSSIGIRVFVFACQKFKHEPKVVFVNCAKEIYDTLDIVGITHMFTFLEDERGQAGPPENEWQEKLEELKKKVMKIIGSIQLFSCISLRVITTNVGNVRHSVKRLSQMSY